MEPLRAENDIASRPCFEFGDYGARVLLSYTSRRCPTLPQALAFPTLRAPLDLGGHMQISERNLGSEFTNQNFNKLRQPEFKLE